MSRKYRVDRLGGLVEITPERDRALAAALERDCRRIRRRLKKSGKIYRAAKWPFEADFSMGLDDDDQIKHARDLLKSHGVPTDYGPNGGPIVTGPEHYKNVQRVLGYYERNSYTNCPVNR